MPDRSVVKEEGIEKDVCLHYILLAVLEGCIMEVRRWVGGGGGQYRKDNCPYYSCEEEGIKKMAALIIFC